MNLRVDLILESEQRSATVLNLRSIVRIVSIAGPAVACLLIAMAVIHLLSLKSELRLLESQWELTATQREQADSELEQFQEVTRMQKEVRGWLRAQPRWSSRILALADAVPPNVQLTGLRVSQTFSLVGDKTPARVFTMQIDGKALGEAAEQSVREIETDLRESAPFVDYVQLVEVPRYGADPSPTASRDDRIFEIRCTDKPLVFDETAGRKKRTN